MTPDGFSMERYRRWAQELAHELENRPALPRLLRKIEVSTYPASAELPFGIKKPRHSAFSEVYENVSRWLDAVRAGLPEAVEVAVDALTMLDVERAASVAIAGLAIGLWPEARNRMARALSRSSREPAFRALLGSLRDTPAARSQLRESPFAKGCGPAQLKLEASPALRYKRVSLPTKADWDALSSKQQERTQERLERLDDADPYDIAEAEALIAYLGEKHCKKSQPIISRLYAEHPSENVRIASGHALMDLGDKGSLADLRAFGDSGDQWRRWFAVKADIAEGPSSAVERLGGEEVLKSDEGRERALCALDVLNVQGDAAQKAKRTPWVRADRRWLDIAAYWTQKGHEDAGYVLRFFPSAQTRRALAQAKVGQRRTPSKAPTRRSRVPPGRAPARLRRRDGGST
jgi:hypothetical protein